jgi:fructan beta-fructosidase
VIADFEGGGYGDWKITGTAFGPGPAQGTLPGQMKVSGYEGKGLVNSFYGGDGSTGTLTSPEFKIRRDYINFLVGGGKYPGETCINLIVDREVVRTATGPNDRPGGSEMLDWYYWDVREFRGQPARIQIVDKRTGGWGHINVDHIHQSNERVEVELEKEREILMSQQYLNFPVKNGAPQRLVHFIIDGRLLAEFRIELADEEPDFWVYLDVSQFEGKTAKLRIDQAPRTGGGFDRAFQDNTFPGEDNLYQEKLRPQFHMTSKRGWNNDTNGMMYYDGEYHLFWQHNPFGWRWGNMTWGHAVSKDLIHWTELGDAIHPDQMGTIFSGSGTVDERNTAGFQTGDEKVLICAYTSAGGTNPWSKGEPFTQSIAYSNDRGRTWTKFAENPVVDHIKGSNRDPKVIWYEPGEHWVMVLYLGDREMGFFTSSDLKDWRYQSKLKCFHECPELFELPIDSDSNRTSWVLYGGSGDYLLGSFDGKTFQPDGDAIKYQHGNCFYASQTFNNIPESDGRRIQMAWGRVAMEGMPFNQMILFPVTLTLRTTDEGLRMFAEPVREIERLHERMWRWANQTVKPGEDPLESIRGELFHIKAKFDVSAARNCGLNIRDISVAYDASSQEISCHGKTAPLKPQHGVITLEILVDRTSIEIFADDGRVYMPIGVHLVDKPTTLGLFTEEGNLDIEELQVHALKSIWCR